MNARIDEQSFKYLRKLAKNNDRDWFKAHREEYEQARENVALFADEMIHRLNRHDLIETVSGKKSMYRIHRDVRFSKDKTPYNRWFSGYFRRATSALRGGYYYRLEPGGRSLIGGGFWGPNKEDLLLIRQQIEMDDEPLRKVLKSSSFKKLFGELKGEQLKTAPKGFSKEHPQIDLLRYKQFLVVREFSDKEVLAPDFIQEAHRTFKGMRPLFDVMSMYLTTDLNGESTL
ncbi:MAG: DUF2461 domain-containing protein [Flavobacteriales bacterium]|nr:DUF2461 domain-containing protein [Flavobacteriales bacterium]